MRSERTVAANAVARILAIAILVPLFSFISPVAAAEEKGLPWEEARRFVEALEKIRGAYVEPVDDATLFRNAMRGMAAGLDPYSAYLDPVEHEQMRIEASGRYEGIGLEIAPLGNGFIVIAPLNGGPAQRAGILPGDALLRVDGAILEGMDSTMLDRIMHGTAGSEVTLTLQRGDEPPFDVVLTREFINIPSISGERLPDGIAYLRITNFSDGSAKDLARQLTRLGRQQQSLQGLILDLRNNAGGVAEAAVAIADEFLADGEIVSTQGRMPNMNQVFRAAPGELVAGVPMVVLVNRGTASAAEILAAALQDNARATLIGTRTFGKAAMQILLPLEDGAALMLTTAYYRTPSGVVIHETGIEPDIEAPGADLENPLAPAEDPLVRQAREWLLNQAG